MTDPVIDDMKQFIATQTRTLVWNGETLTATFGSYPSNGNTWIQLLEANGAPYAKATINLTFKIHPSMVAIKTIDENKGLLEALEAAKIVTWVGQTTPCGFYDAYVCRINTAPQPEPEKAVEVKVGSDDDTGRDFDLTKLPIESLRIVRNWLNAQAGAAQAAAEDTLSIQSYKPGFYMTDDITDVIDSGKAEGAQDAIDTMYTEVLKAIDTVNAANMVDTNKKGG